MGQVGYFRRVYARAERAFTRAGDHWVNTLGEIEAGNFDVQRFVGGIVRSAADSVDAWGAFLDFGGSPQLPTVHIQVRAVDAKNVQPGTAWLTEAIPAAEAVTHTGELKLLGQAAAANPMDVVNVLFASAWREEVTVEVRARNTANADPAPTQGVYMGMVFRGGGVPVAMITVHVTP